MKEVGVGGRSVGRVPGEMHTVVVEKLEDLFVPANHLGIQVEQWHLPTLSDRPELRIDQALTNNRPFNGRRTAVTIGADLVIGF